MQSIKLAYEWIGPKGPISNNDYPNINDFTNQYNQIAMEYDYHSRIANLSHLISDIIETSIVPVSEIKENDSFLYEINLDFKHPSFVFDSFYPSHISPRIRHILNNDNSKGYYAFNLCLEGWCDDRFLQKLYEFLRSKQINTNKVILFNGATNAQALHDIWARRNNVCDPINIVSCNNYYKIPKQRINNKKSRSKKFVCFNRRWKSHRLLLYVYLHKHKLLDHFYFSLPRESISHPSHSFYAITKNLLNKHSLDIDDSDINSAFNDLPMVLDDKNFERVNWWEHNKLSQYHTDSYISIVNETMFEESAIFPTEKTFRPMSFAQPFITLGSSGFLEGLRSMGFKTFDAIDESYDKIADNSDRIKTVLEMIRDMCSWPEDKFEGLIASTQTACLHNYQLLSTTIPKLNTLDQLNKIYDNR